MSSLLFIPYSSFVMLPDICSIMHYPFLMTSCIMSLTTIYPDPPSAGIVQRLLFLNLFSVSCSMALCGVTNYLVIALVLAWLLAPFSASASHPAAFRDSRWYRAASPLSVFSASCSMAPCGVTNYLVSPLVAAWFFARFSAAASHPDEVRIKRLDGISICIKSIICVIITHGGSRGISWRTRRQNLVAGTP